MNFIVLISPSFSLFFCTIYKYFHVYNNEINARALTGQSAMGYCAGKPMEKALVFWIII